MPQINDHFSQQHRQLLLAGRDPVVTFTSMPSRAASAFLLILVLKSVSSRFVGATTSSIRSFHCRPPIAPPSAPTDNARSHLTSVSGGVSWGALCWLTFSCSLSEKLFFRILASQST
ncbi:hypothetical protein AAHC03_026647 [Spirometra sp. Aus1]